MKCKVWLHWARKPKVVLSLKFVTYLIEYKEKTSINLFQIWIVPLLDPVFDKRMYRPCSYLGHRCAVSVPLWRGRLHSICHDSCRVCTQLYIALQTIRRGSQDSIYFLCVGYECLCKIRLHRPSAPSKICLLWYNFHTKQVSKVRNRIGVNMISLNCFINIYGLLQKW